MKRSFLLRAGGIGVCGVLAVSLAQAQRQTGKAAPVAHNQAEFDALSKGMTGASELDALGHSYDNEAAHLFWFTDLEAAKTESKKTGKPILSLRLLGNLSDEYSCANSRFFRTALYPNAGVNALLRDKFVLHWSRERPVPVVTIDFGDGRKLKRTLTGNSAHYLLDAQGQPLDVLPGLYGPGAFTQWLQDGQTLFHEVEGKSGDERQEVLKTYHEAALRAAWVKYAEAVNANDADSKWVDENVKNSFKTNPLLREASDSQPAAESAAGLAVTKMISRESFLLNATRLYNRPRVPDDSLFEMGVKGYEADAKLDDNGRRVLLAKRPVLDMSPPRSKPRFLAGGIALGQLLVNSQADATPTNPTERLIGDFEHYMAIDTQRNELMFHIPIHAAFVEGKQGDFQTLNSNVYGRLFLTPNSDPWLGLSSAGVYTGLQNGGVVGGPNMTSGKVGQQQVTLAQNARQNAE